MAKDYLHKGRSMSQNVIKCFWVCSRCVKYKHLVTCKNTIEIYLYIIPNLMFQILNPLGMSGPFGKLPVWLQHVYCPHSPSLGGCTVAICDDTHTKIQGSEVHVASSWYSSSQVARGLPIVNLCLASAEQIPPRQPQRVRVGCPIDGLAVTRTINHTPFQDDRVVIMKEAKEVCVS